MRGLIQSKLGTDAEITNVELTYVSCTSAVANAFLNLLCSMVGETGGLEELTLKKFANTLELDAEVLSNLADRCKNRLRKLVIWGM